MCVCEVGGESDGGRGNSMDCYEVGGGSEGGGGNSMDCHEVGKGVREEGETVWIVNYVC